MIIHKLRITNEANAPFRMEGTVSRLEIDLNLADILTGTPRRLRSLTAEGVTLDIRRNAQPAAPSQRFAWPVLNHLLSDNFKFSGVQLHVDDGSTVVNLREATLTGSQLESGVFTAKEIAIDSPWFRRNFSSLRGATSWQESRLMIGAMSLLRGLDLDTVTVDLSALGESRIGLEMHLDAFGGKVRARVSSDDRGDKRIWDVAGDGSGDFSRPNVGRARLDEPGQRLPPRLQIHFPRRNGRCAKRDRLALGRSERVDLAGSHGRHRHDRRGALQPRGASRSRSISSSATTN